MGTNENAIFYGHTIINGYIVLNFDVIPDGYASIYKDTFTNDAVLTNFGSWAHLSLVPYAGRFADRGIWRNICRRVNLNGQVVEPFASTFIDIKAVVEGEKEIRNWKLELRIQTFFTVALLLNYLCQPWIKHCGCLRSGWPPPGWQESRSSCGL